MLFLDNCEINKNVVVLPGGRYIIHTKLTEIPVYEILTRMHNVSKFLG